MSKHRRHRVEEPAGGADRPTGPSDGFMLQATRLACYVGFPALLVLSPIWFYMSGAKLGSENSIFQWSLAEMVAIAVTALWLAAIAVGHVPRIRLHWVDAALGGFFLISLVASLLVPYHFDSSRRLKEMLAGVAVFFVVKNAFASERDQRTLVRVMMGMLGLLSVVGVVHYLWYVADIRLLNPQGREIGFLSMSLRPDAVAWEKDFGVRAASIIGNPNFLASLLLVLVPMGLAWLVTARRPRIPQAALGAAVVWVVVAAVLVGSASSPSQRMVTLGKEIQGVGGRPPTTQQELDQKRAEQQEARKAVANLAGWATAWTLLGVAGLIVALVLWPFFGVALAVFFGFALLLFTNSWAAFSGMIAGLAFFALMVYLKRPARFRPQTAIGVGVALGVALVGFFVVKAASKSYIIPPPEARTGLRSRELLWDTVPLMVKERPILGFGAENFFTYSNKYMSRILPGPSHYEEVLVLNPRAFSRPPGAPAPTRMTFFPEEDPPPGTVSLLTKGERLVMEKHAAIFINNPSFIQRNEGRTHSEYLSVIVETGFVGLAVYILLFVFLYRGSLSAWRRGEDSWRSVVLLGAMTAITAIAVMQTVDFPYRLAEASMLISATLALATTWHRGRAVKLPRSLPVAAKGVLALLVAAAGVYLEITTFEHVRSLQLFNAAKQELGMRGIPTGEVLATYEHVYALRPLDHNLYFELPEMALYLGQLSKADEYLRTLERIQPFHEKMELMWGHYYRKTGDLARAVEHYRRSIALEPRYLVARMFLIETLIRADRLDEAKKALAETWPWEAETEARMMRGQAEPGLVKMEGEMVLVHMDDLFWPWVMNEEAVVQALEGDFGQARATWRATMARWAGERASLQTVEQGAYGLYPEIPIFALNPGLLDTTTPEEVRKNQAQWATKFRGIGDYGALKRFDDLYKATFAWGGKPGGPPPIMRPDEAATIALDALEQIARDDRLGARALTLDGNLGREYYNRRGLQMLRMGRPDLAMQEFQSSAETEAANVARANIAEVMAMTQSGEPPHLLDESSYAAILWQVDPGHHSDLAGYVENIKAFRAAYPNFDFVPLVATQIGARIRQGDTVRAGQQFAMLEQVCPGDSRLTQIRALLGP